MSADHCVAIWGCEPEHLRAQAAQMRRIARSINDDTVRERLLELAQEHQKKAEEIASEEAI